MKCHRLIKNLTMFLFALTLIATSNAKEPAKKNNKKYSLYLEKYNDGISIKSNRFLGVFVGKGYTSKNHEVSTAAGCKSYPGRWVNEVGCVQPYHLENNKEELEATHEIEEMLDKGDEIDIYWEYIDGDFCFKQTRTLRTCIRVNRNKHYYAEIKDSGEILEVGYLKNKI